MRPFAISANSYVQTGIAIDPQRAENGALIAVVPGSHKLGELPFDPERPSMFEALDKADLAKASASIPTTP